MTVLPREGGNKFSLAGGWGWRWGEGGGVGVGVGTTLGDKRPITLILRF